jgi:hypothetical protein
MKFNFKERYIGIENPLKIREKYKYKHEPCKSVL